MLGLGLDGTDGHTRITAGRISSSWRSKDTHDAMQEIAIKVNEELDRRQKRLEDLRGTSC